MSLLCNQPSNMDCYLSEQQIEELVNFDQYEDLSDLIEEEQVQHERIPQLQHRLLIQ